MAPTNLLTIFADTLYRGGDLRKMKPVAFSSYILFYYADKQLNKICTGKYSNYLKNILLAGQDCRSKIDGLETGRKTN